MIRIVLAVSMTLSFSLFAAPQVRILNAQRIIRKSQTLLNWHIQERLRIQKEKEELGQQMSNQEKLQTELCFLKVETAPAQLEIYLKICPQTSGDLIVDQQVLTEFRSSHKAVNVFDLSAPVKSNAVNEFEDLKETFKKEWTTEWATQKAADIDRAQKAAEADSLGQLIFAKLGTEKINVGYIAPENLIMDLCSGAWDNLCYFESPKYRSQGKFLILAFQEYDVNVEEEYDVSKSDWLKARRYVDFQKVLGSALYSRGNDDSRDQATYWLTLKNGKKVPITEEWYFYFALNTKTRHLVSIGKEKSHRTRAEWNYMTALHPVHLIQTKDRQSGEVKVSLFMGASVFYNSKLEIEDADCDMAETEGFSIVDLKTIDSLSDIGSGDVLSPLERKIFFQDYAKNGEAYYEGKIANLNKVWETRFVPAFESGSNEPVPNSQMKYIPVYSDDDSLKRFGMKASGHLKRGGKQSYAIMKESYGFQEFTERPSSMITPENDFILATQVNQNQLKEFLTLTPLNSENTKYSIQLSGFNPNEMLATNTTHETVTGYHLRVDPEAVRSIWSSENPDLVMTSHTISRDAAEYFRKLKVSLNSKYYKDNGEERIGKRRRVPELAIALEAGEVLKGEERDDHIAELDNHFRLVGKNVNYSLGVRGKSDYIRDLMYDARRSIIAEMREEDWVFPTYVLTQKWIPQQDDPLDEITEIKKEDVTFLKVFTERAIRADVEIKEGEEIKKGGAPQLLLEDYQNTIQAVLTNDAFVSMQVGEVSSFKNFTKLFQSGGRYFSLFSDLSLNFDAAKKATPQQNKIIGDKIKTEETYASLKDFAFYSLPLRNRPSVFVSFKRKELLLKLNKCFLEAEKDVPKHKLCEETASKYLETLQALLNEVGVSLF